MLLSIAAIEIPGKNTARQAFLLIIPFLVTHKIALGNYFLIRIVVKKAGSIGEGFLNYCNIFIKRRASSFSFSR
jgi:hypothetical protein